MKPDLKIVTVYAQEFLINGEKQFSLVGRDGIKNVDVFIPAYCVLTAEDVPLQLPSDKFAIIEADVLYFPVAKPSETLRLSLVRLVEDSNSSQPWWSSDYGRFDNASIKKIHQIIFEGVK